MPKIKKIWKFLPYLFFFFALLNFRVILITGNSMSPTLQNGSFAIVDKNLFKLFEIKKNDILVFQKDKEEVVKKIVGFPNETITIENKEIKLNESQVYLLGENLPESIDSRSYGPLNSKSIIGKVVLSF